MSNPKRVEISISEKRMLNAAELMAYTGMGYTRAVEWGKKIGAVRFLGRLMFFDRLKVDTALDSMGANDNAYAGLDERAF